MARNSLLIAGRHMLRQSRRLQCPDTYVQRRMLSLHEYQGQELLRQFGIPVLRGAVASTPSETGKVVRDLDSKCILKPQVLSDKHHLFRTSARAQLVAVAVDPASAETAASQILGQVLGQEQPNSAPAVRQVYVEEVIDHDSWIEVTIGINREKFCPQFRFRHGSASATAAEGKEFVVDARYFDPIPETDMSELFAFLQLPSYSSGPFSTVLGRLNDMFLQRDITTLESRLFYSEKDNTFFCSSSRIVIDDAASKRHPDLFSKRDVGWEVPEEVEAEGAGLVYIKMDGNIGNVVNGAGLAMATNDAIAAYGGTSANFLDTGGQATVETMRKAFSIILRDPRVKAILVNIYGGIIQCDMIAASIISSAETLGPIPVPVVVRLQGTNSEKGLRLLEEADLGLHVESDFGKAASRAVELAGK